MFCKSNTVNFKISNKTLLFKIFFNKNGYQIQLWFYDWHLLFKILTNIVHTGNYM